MDVAFVLIHEDLDVVVPVGFWDHTDDSHQMSSAVSRPASSAAMNSAAALVSASVASLKIQGGDWPGFDCPCPNLPSTFLPMFGASCDWSTLGNTRVSW